MAHNRIEWLSLLRALNIVLVVMFHVVLIDMATGDNHPFCSLITAPLLPVRMPLFIFISGGLLFTSRIAKGWGNGALYVDKLKRIMVPFLFFVTALFAFKAALNYVMQQDEEAEKSIEGIAATLTVLLEKVLDEEQNMEGQDS